MIVDLSDTWQLNCTWVELRKDPKTGQLTRTSWPVAYRARQYTVFDTEYKCFAVNYDWNETPGASAENPHDYISCSMQSNTNVRVTAFRQQYSSDQNEPQPTTRFDEWVNVDLFASHALSARTSKWTLLGSASMLFYDIWSNMVILRYSWRDLQRLTHFRMYMSFVGELENRRMYF